jgi:formylglycine-generating enzyme required for sulfatase activity
MASGMAGDPDRFISEICRVNPLLAGKCLTRGAAEVAGRMSSLVARKILDVIGDARKPLPVRLGSGEILGRIGDPRFPVQQGGSGSYIAPQLIRIPAGLANLGSGARDAEAFEDERPRRRMKVPAFEIGRYPVTNAEYAQFVAAGGYGQSRCWTDGGWQWRQAWDNGEGSISRMLRNVAYFRGHTDDMEARLEETRAPEPERELWRALVRSDDAAARRRLVESGRVRLRSKDKPAFFDHRRFNGANQPVVGVTWFEAMAYCSWLSYTSGRRFLLPTEPQWERAAKGDSTALYPWGAAWDRDRCNAAPERILRTTPVGIFPKGRSPYGCEDMAGNVFEWTLSLYAPYPYTDAALREDPKVPGVRVNRGGGWDSPRRVARCALRGDMCDSQTYDSNLGFRLTAG